MHRDVDRGASLRTDPSIYALYGIICAQRRQSGNVSAHSVHIKGCSFGRPSVQILRFARNDNERVLRMTTRGCLETFLVAIDEAASLSP